MYEPLTEVVKLERGIAVTQGDSSVLNARYDTIELREATKADKDSAELAAEVGTYCQASGEPEGAWLRLPSECLFNRHLLHAQIVKLSDSTGTLPELASPSIPATVLGKLYEVDEEKIDEAQKRLRIRGRTCPAAAKPAAKVNSNAAANGPDTGPVITDA
jgi:hypothetical protein